MAALGEESMLVKSVKLGGRVDIPKLDNGLDNKEEYWKDISSSRVLFKTVNFVSLSFRRSLVAVASVT